MGQAKHRCAATVGAKGSMGKRYGDCHNPAKFTEAGEHYCGLHAPSKVKARLAANEAKSKAKWDGIAAMRDRRNEIHRAEGKLVEAAKAWGRARAQWEADPTAKNQEAKKTTFATLRDLVDAMVRT